MSRFSLFLAAFTFAASPFAFVPGCVAARQFQAPPPQELVAPAAPCLGVDSSTILAAARVPAAVSGASRPAAREENERGLAILSQPHPDFAAARRLFEKAAFGGYAPAQVNLAIAYLEGWGAPRNDGAALYWLTTASDQGYARAQMNLALLYMRGCGVARDDARAFSLLHAAADQGEVMAQLDLGYMYDRGDSVRRDPAQAAVWYRKAANAGEAHAQYNLADLYAQGEGVQQDDIQAFQWFEKAAMQGHGKARVMLGLMYSKGRGTRKDLLTAYAWIAAADIQGEPHAKPALEQLASQLPPESLEEATKRARALAESTSNTQNEIALLR